MAKSGEKFSEVYRHSKRMGYSTPSKPEDAAVFGATHWVNASEVDLAV